MFHYFLFLTILISAPPPPPSLPAPLFLSFARALSILFTFSKGCTLILLDFLILKFLSCFIKNNPLLIQECVAQSGSFSNFHDFLFY